MQKLLVFCERTLEEQALALPVVGNCSLFCGSSHRGYHQCTDIIMLTQSITNSGVGTYQANLDSTFNATIAPLPSSFAAIEGSNDLRHTSTPYWWLHYDIGS